MKTKDLARSTRGLRRLPTALPLLLLALAAAPPPALAQTGEGYDHHRPVDRLVTRGMHALMLCNGLFVSERPLELVYEQELTLYGEPVLPPGEVAIDGERCTVAGGARGWGGSRRATRSGSTSGSP